jgi:hypothetical protein
LTLTGAGRVPAILNVGERAPVLQNLAPSQRDLADFMSRLSERAWFAGWMSNLEYHLWDALVGGPRDYGRIRISDADAVQLLALSNACRGWIVFDDLTEETWVPLATWLSDFAQRKRDA